MFAHVSLQMFILSVDVYIWECVYGCVNYVTLTDQKITFLLLFFYLFTLCFFSLILPLLFPFYLSFSFFHSCSLSLSLFPYRFSLSVSHSNFSISLTFSLYLSSFSFSLSSFFSPILLPFLSVYLWLSLCISINLSILVIGIFLISFNTVKMNDWFNNGIDMKISNSHEYFWKKLFDPTLNKLKAPFKGPVHSVKKLLITNVTT